MASGIDFQSLFQERERTEWTFTDFLDDFCESPGKHLLTSQQLIFDALSYFGYEIVVRAGEPVISFKIFRDLFGNGTNAVFGQEFSIKAMVDVLEAVGREAGPPRGLILVGPPASGKTNVVDLINQALEEYTKQEKTELYTFSFVFTDDDLMVEMRSNFNHNPLLLVPVTMRGPNGVAEPRQELFNYVRQLHNLDVHIPGFYRTATLDKRQLDIISKLRDNPRNRGKSLYDIYNEYIRIDRLQFSVSQGTGISNIDDMQILKTRVSRQENDPRTFEAIAKHIPGFNSKYYEGAIVSSNRGILHIHDAFTYHGPEGPSESEYKPLLMLLGSGKVALESTQASVDTSVIVTTNLEEMEMLERQLTSSKLIDRIEKVPMNYLLDFNSELKILERDLGSLRGRYDIDPNLLRIATYFSVMTRLLPPKSIKDSGPYWSDDRRDLYQRITPEQKLILYAYRAEDPISTIRRLPPQHPFLAQAARLGLDIEDAEALSRHIVYDYSTSKLEAAGIFANEDIKLIDDRFMRTMLREYWLTEGTYGISVRQLQNIMRNTISSSDGARVLTTTFLEKLDEAVHSGQNRWVQEMHPEIQDAHEGMKPIPMRMIGNVLFSEGEGYYNNYSELARVAKALYHDLIMRHITISVVDRNPMAIEADLRRYLQYCCLQKAINNRAFSHVMIPRFSFVDPKSGEKVESPDESFMSAIEAVIFPNERNVKPKREAMADKLLDLIASEEVKVTDDRALMYSSDDGLLDYFGTEFSKLLSNRRVDPRIHPEQLAVTFFNMRSDPNFEPSEEDVIAQFAKKVIERMHQRFRYSREIAFDTILYAIRERVLNFAEMLTSE